MTPRLHRLRPPAAALLGTLLPLALSHAADVSIVRDIPDPPYARAYGLDIGFADSPISGDSVSIDLRSATYSSAAAHNSDVLYLFGIELNGRAPSISSGTGGLTVRMNLNGVLSDATPYTKQQAGIYWENTDGRFPSHSSIVSSGGSNRFVFYDALPQDPGADRGSVQTGRANRWITLLNSSLTIEGESNSFAFEPLAGPDGKPWFDTLSRAREETAFSVRKNTNTWDESQRLVLSAQSGDNTLSMRKGGTALTVGARARYTDSSIALLAPQGRNVITLAPELAGGDVWAAESFSSRDQSYELAGDSMLAEFAGSLPPEDRRALAELSAAGNEITVIGSSLTTNAAALRARKLGLIRVSASALGNAVRVRTSLPAAKAYGALADYWGSVSVEAAGGSNALIIDPAAVAAAAAGARASSRGTVSASAPQGENILAASADAQAAAAARAGASDVWKSALLAGAIADSEGTVSLRARANTLAGDASGLEGLALSHEGYGALALSQGTVSVLAEDGLNRASGSTSGLAAKGGSITLSSAQGNVIEGGEKAIWALSDESGEVSEVRVTGPVSASLTDAGAEGGAAIEADASGIASASAAVTLDYAGQSAVSDSIVAKNGGRVDIAPASGTIAITGSLIGSGGTLTAELSPGSVLRGGADDGRLAAQRGQQAARGTVNLTLAGGAQWIASESSAVTSLSGGGSVEIAHGGRSVQIGELSGSHEFALDLSWSDPSSSDMLYIGQGTSEPQTLRVKNIEALDAEMPDGARVPFAMVRNSGGEFVEGRAYTVENGLTNDTLTVAYEEGVPDALGADGPTPEQAAELYGGSSAYLVKKAGSRINDGGVTPSLLKDIVWHYVADLDTYTKRTAQSEWFVPGTGRGAWLRARWRSLGVSGAGRISGETYELGATAVLADAASHRRSLAASVSGTDEDGHFSGVHGSLSVKDAALSLFDTHEWELGEGARGYADTVLKLRRVRTRGDARDRETGVRHTGSYHQSVASLSGEAGVRMPLSERVFLTPQVQLQGARIGGYSYRDSQGVSVDAQNGWSLISRMGFDAAVELAPAAQGRAYAGVSLLHEFCDGSGALLSARGQRAVADPSQRGTWASISAGVSARTGGLALWLDAETLAGNGYSGTYSVRAGLNWRF